VGGGFEFYVFIFYFKLHSEGEKDEEKQTFGASLQRNVHTSQKVFLKPRPLLLPTDHRALLQPETPCLSPGPAASAALWGELSSHCKPKKHLSQPQQQTPGPTARVDVMFLVSCRERAGTGILENGLYTFTVRRGGHRDVAADLSSKHFLHLVRAKYWLPSEVNLPFLCVPLACRTTLSVILLSIISNQLGTLPLLRC